MASRRRAHVVRAILIALMSAGLIVFSSVMAIAPTAQAAAFGAGVAGRMAVGAVAAAPSAPCVVSIDAPTCQSTDPDLTVDVVNTGDTSACTFTYSINWGDGSAAQQVTINGEPQSGDYLLADHTYKATQTYTVTATSVSITGPCTSGPGSYTFTLDAGATACPPTPQPTIYWSQIAGPQGTKFTLTGNGWYPNETVAVHLPSGSAFHVTSTSWRASSTGGWQLRITVGSSARLGTYRLSFAQSQPGCGGLLVSGNFKVTLTVSQYASSVAAIYQLVSAANSVCHILNCSKPWNNSMASSAIGIIDTALTVFYETKAIPESIIVGNDLKALENALKKAHNNKKNPAVQKAVKKLKADTTVLENTLIAICPPLELLFPPAVS
jgi:hypothetical protein